MLYVTNTNTNEKRYGNHTKKYVSSSENTPRFDTHMYMHISVSLGNDNIHQITSHGSYRLTVILTDWDGTTAFAIYNNFSIASETDAYRLSIIQFAGTDAGNRRAPSF